MWQLFEYVFYNSVLVILGVLSIAVVVIVVTGLLNIHRLPRLVRRIVIAVRLYSLDRHGHYNWRFSWYTAKHLTEE